jgi:hypothetical protein
VLQPGAIEAALHLAETAADDHTATRTALALELREARYEAGRAQRQYDAAEPEHRLVAATLEQRWNAALARVHELEARLAVLTVDTAQPAPPDRATLRRLAEDFPRVWHHPTTDHRTKKRIVRLLIEEIIAKIVSGPREEIVLTIHWKGGQHTELVLPRNRTGQHRRVTDRAIVDVVRDLARVQADQHIARVLNRLGYRTGAGNTWTEPRVLSLRRYHQIPAFDRAVDRQDTLTIAGAATALGISATTVRRLIMLGLLPATQPVLYAPWIIRRQDLERAAVQHAVGVIKAGGVLPRTPDAGQLTFEKSTT